MKVLTRSEFDQKGSSQKTLQTICLGCPFQKQNASLEDSIEDFCSAKGFMFRWVSKISPEP